MGLEEEVAPTEEVVKALLDYLVDPMLPLKATGKDPPLPTQKEVAKQMHAVVLLYNYYHREQNAKLEFLEFEAFCKLAVSLKPALMAHMKYMQQTVLTGSDDMESQLSVTENAIKDACRISSALFSLKDVSDTEGWPVSKVSVLLMDSKKENCLLLFGSITNGSWSVIERCLDSSNIHSESPSSKHTTKRKQMGKTALTDEQSNIDLAFREVAFSAVEEETGINQSEVVVLERHVVYSLSEENMAAYFYIMQCNQSSSEAIQVPIRDAIESLQGPLLKRSSNCWTLTPKIEYYNVLPYAQVMSGWLSREGVSACSETLNCSNFQTTGQDTEKEAAENEKANPNVLHNFSVELGDINVNSSQGPEKPSDEDVPENGGSIIKKCTNVNFCDKEPVEADSSNRKEEVDVKDVPDEHHNITDSNAKSLSDADRVASRKTSAEEHQLTPNCFSKRWKKDDDGFGTPWPTSGGKNKNLRGPMKVYHHQKRKISAESVDGSSLAVTRCNMDTSDAKKSNRNELYDGKVAGICSREPTSSLQNGILGADCALVAFESGAKTVDKLQTMLAAQDTAISEAANKILSKKIQEICHQQHILEEELALFRRDMQKMNDGNQDALTLKLKALVDYCKDTCLKDKTQVQEETQCSRTTRLSNANISFQSPFEELDHICQENMWRIPIYSISASPAGFVATIIMKEKEFDLSLEGVELSTPRAARESAASLMVAKLRELLGYS